MVDDEETITVKELGETLRRYLGTGWLFGHDAEGLAVALVASAKSRREPAYKEGAYYQDANGEVYKCLGGELCNWEGFNKFSRYVSSYYQPKRPLTRLIPER